jgi:glyoxylase I family protein
MPKRSLDHASVRIRNLEDSRKFYEDLLGFTPASRPDLGFPGAWYALGEGQLHLIQHQGVFDGIDPTAPHFAVEVDDLDAMRRRLQDAGMKILDFGAAQLWVLDPDGNTVELCRRRVR